MRYRYSKDIVYNNFIWPEELLSLRGDSEFRRSGEDSKKKPTSKPPKLPVAKATKTRVAHLFKLYAEKMKKKK